MTTSRNTSSNPPRSGRRDKKPELSAGAEPDGYDADGGDPETGLDPSDVSLESQQDEDDDQTGMSLDAEDLGPRMLQNAVQGGGGGHFEANSVDAGMSEPSGLDLTRDVIDEGSLFDQPRDENGGTRRPQIRTNEVDATLERNLRASRERLKSGSRRRSG